MFHGSIIILCHLFGVLNKIALTGSQTVLDQHTQLVFYCCENGHSHVNNILHVTDFITKWHQLLLLDWILLWRYTYYIVTIIIVVYIGYLIIDFMFVFRVISICIQLISIPCLMLQWAINCKIFYLSQKITYFYLTSFSKDHFLKTAHMDSLCHLANYMYT